MWVVAGVAVAPPTLRVVIVGLNAGELGLPELLLYALALPFVILVLIMMTITTSIGRGLLRLQRDHPDALVTAVAMHVDSSDAFQRLTGTSRAVGRSLYLDATFESDRVRFWRGRRPRLFATLPTAGMRVEVVEIQTVAGSFPAVALTAQLDASCSVFRLTPMDERRILFPRQLTRASVIELAARARTAIGARESSPDLTVRPVGARGTMST